MKRYKRLGESDRITINVLSKKGFSDADIARDIGVHRATVGREKRRNTTSGPAGKRYYYHLAQELAEKRQKERGRRRSRMTTALAKFIELKIKVGWSPQQISGWLKYRQDKLPAISHERIYQHVWNDKFDGGKLHRHLRHGGRRWRRYRWLGRKARRYGPIPDRVDIDQRPAIVEKKDRVGDWELDTMIGSKRRGVLVSMVERGSKFLRLALVHEPKSETVARAIESSLAKDSKKVLTMTMDNGWEFAKHREFGARLKADTFFAKPYSAWQRGLNEHTNGLVRQYFPKATDFTTLSADDVQKVEERLNNRPRAVLGFRTPLEVFSRPSSLRYVALAA